MEIASAQNATSKGNKLKELSDRISEIYQHRVEIYLERTFEKDEFTVIVNAENIVTSNLELPFLKTAPSNEALESLGKGRLRGLIKNINIEIAIAKDIPANVRSQIKKTLSDRLGLNASDSINVKKAPFLIKAKNEFENKLNQSQNDIRATKLQNDTLKKEREDALRSATVYKTENERLKSDLTIKSGEVSVLQKNNKIETHTLIETFKNASPLLICGILLALAVSLIGFGFFGTGQKLSSSFNAIAQSIKSIQISDNQNSSGGNPSTIAMLPEDHISDPKNSPLIGSQVMTLESIQARIAKLCDSITLQLTPTTEALILQYIMNIALKKKDISRAVITLELLGKEVANKLFQRLPLDTQDQILKFLKEGTYGHAKSELMLETGEELMTKLMAESFMASRSALDQKVYERLYKIPRDEIVNIFTRIDADLVPRLVLYTDAPLLSEILQKVKRKDSVRFKELAVLLSRLPEAERSQAKDEAILSYLDSTLSQIRSNAHLGYIKFYQEIVEGVDEDTGDELVNLMGASYPLLEKQIRSNMVNIQTLFQLPKHLMLEFTTKVSNKHLAVLANQMGQKITDLFFAQISARRRDMIQDELNILANIPADDLKVLFKAARDKAVVLMKQWQAQGYLEALEQQNDVQVIVGDIAA